VPVPITHLLVVDTAALEGGAPPNLTRDQATADEHASDPITLGNRPWSRADAPSVLARQLESLPRSVSDTQRVLLGIYRGLRFGMVLHPHFPPDVYLEGATTRRDTLSREHQGPRAVLNSLERLASGYGSEIVRLRQDLTVAESQLRDYQARLVKPFPHDAYLNDLTELRDQLKSGLSTSARGSDGEKGPTVSDLAERIKMLKAAHTVEATPQRPRQAHATAEEPVTARIRRRQEALPISNQAVGHDGEGNAWVTLSPETTEISASKPAMGFRERIEMERRRQDSAPELG
jgi:hypothetical protein